MYTLLHSEARLGHSPINSTYCSILVLAHPMDVNIGYLFVCSLIHVAMARLARTDRTLFPLFA
jgi:hypothetical protein